jgi:hypothetical protein
VAVDSQPVDIQPTVEEHTDDRPEDVVEMSLESGHAAENRAIDDQMTEERIQGEADESFVNISTEDANAPGAEENAAKRGSTVNVLGEEGREESVEDERSMVVVESGDAAENGASDDQITEEGIQGEVEHGEESHRREGYEDLATKDGNASRVEGDAAKSGSTVNVMGEKSREESVDDMGFARPEQGEGDGREGLSLETSMEVIVMGEAQDGDQDTTISLDTLPTPKDTKVKDIQTHLMETIMFLQVINTLAIIGRYLRITTNATADDASLLISQQTALFESLKLCDNLSLMMQNFQSGANNILEKLKVGYLYLLDGFPDFAVTDIAAISKDVDSMKTATKKMQTRVWAVGKNMKEMKPQVEEALAKRELRLENAEEMLRMLMMEPVPISQPPETEQSCFLFRLVTETIRHLVSVALRIMIRLVSVPLRIMIYLVSVSLCIMRHLVIELARYITSFEIARKTLGFLIFVVEAPPIRFFRSEWVHGLKWFKDGLPEEVPLDTSCTCNPDVSHSVTEDKPSLRQRRVGEMQESVSKKPTEKMQGSVEKNPTEKMQESVAKKPTEKMQGSVEKNPTDRILDAAEIRSLKYDIRKYRDAICRVKLVLLTVSKTELLLKSIEGILMKSTDLVQTWYKECADVIEPSMTKTVTVVERRGEKEKMKYWTSLQFKQEVQLYYCR